MSISKTAPAIPRAMARRSEEARGRHDRINDTDCFVVYVKGRVQSCQLTVLLLQNDFGHGTKLSLLWFTVGHVEIEALQHHQLVLHLLILPAAHYLLLLIPHLHRHGRVPFFAFGLGDVRELHDRLVPARHSDDPGDVGERHHTPRPVWGGQQGRGRQLWTDSVNNSLCRGDGDNTECQHCILSTRLTGVSSICGTIVPLCGTKNEENVHIQGAETNAFLGHFCFKMA